MSYSDHGYYCTLLIYQYMTYKLKTYFYYVYNSCYLLKNIEFLNKQTLKLW